METAGKQVEDEEMRDLLKDNGIGRPSTRANIIETLFKRKYIEKKRKNIIATQTGIALIDTIQNELLKSAELTGDWEKKLRLIEKGEYELEVFKKELYQMVRELTDEVIFNTKAPQADAFRIEEKKKAAPKPAEPQLKIEDVLCPKCKKLKLITGKTSVVCSDYKVCDFKVPFEILRKKLTNKQIVDLCLKSKTSKIKGFTFEGKTEKVDGKLILDDSFNLQFEKE